MGKKICLSISAHHPEEWQAAWGVRLMLEALISFLPTEGGGALGALDYSPAERKRLAKQSVDWCCARCGKASGLLPDPSEEEDEEEEDDEGGEVESRGAEGAVAECKPCGARKEKKKKKTNVSKYAAEIAQLQFVGLPSTPKASPKPSPAGASGGGGGGSGGGSSGRSGGGAAEAGGKNRFLSPPPLSLNSSPGGVSSSSSSSSSSTPSPSAGAGGGGAASSAAAPPRQPAGAAAAAAAAAAATGGAAGGGGGGGGLGRRGGTAAAAPQAQQQQQQQQQQRPRAQQAAQRRGNNGPVPGVGIQQQEAQALSGHGLFEDPLLWVAAALGVAIAALLWQKLTRLAMLL